MAIFAEIEITPPTGDLVYLISRNNVIERVE